MSSTDTLSALRGAGYCVFARAIEASEYGDVLDGGPFTLFAPTDAAFGKFSHSALDQFLNKNSERLRRVMGYHFVAGKVVAERLLNKRYRAVMYGGLDLIIDGRTQLRVNKASVVEPDILAGLSVIHGIDGVLWPREPAAAAR